MTDIVEELRLLQSGAQWACGQTAETLEQAADEIERLRAALRRLVDWGAACPTTSEARLSHASEGTKAFHQARIALGEPGHD